MASGNFFDQREVEDGRLDYYVEGPEIYLLSLYLKPKGTSPSFFFTSCTASRLPNKFRYSLLLRTS